MSVIKMTRLGERIGLKEFENKIKYKKYIRYMFTGIVETLGEVVGITDERTNKHVSVRSEITDELKIDQSISHNGVCLTVVKLEDDIYTVTAIEETLLKSNLGELKVGDCVNLERCMLMNGRLDGHIVQGHVDQVATCIAKTDHEGSYVFRFEYNAETGNVTVEKGSVCVNGVSLTVINAEKEAFSVAIIPYTYEHTNFKQLAVGDKVNIEFDIIGKYVSKLLSVK